MATGGRAAEASALIIAGLAVKLAADDPELVKRLQEAARSAETPFSPDRVNERGLELIYEILLIMAGRAALGHTPSPDDEPKDRVTLPMVKGMEAQSAAAIGLGSFAIEYLHAAPGAMDSFTAYMDAEHPASEASQHVTAERLRAADKMLTLLAGVAHGIVEAMPEGEDPQPVSDDGIRHV